MRQPTKFRPRKINLGEERILLGKIAEGGRSEPLNSCFCLRQLRAKRSSGGFRPKSFCEFGDKEKARRAISFFVFSFKNAPAISQKLTETSEFNEVYFSERRNFEANHKIPTSKNKFGRGTNFAWQNSRRRSFRTVKFLFLSPPVTSEAEFWRISSEKFLRIRGQGESQKGYQFLRFFLLKMPLQFRKN